MIKEINTEKQKMKHIINVKTEAPLDAEDFLFEFIQAMDEKNWPLDGKGRTMPQLKWAGLLSPIDGLTVDKSMEEIVKLGRIETKDARGTTYHTMINHPW